MFVQYSQVHLRSSTFEHRDTSSAPAQPTPARPHSRAKRLRWYSCEPAEFRALRRHVATSCNYGQSARSRSLWPHARTVDPGCIERVSFVFLRPDACWHFAILVGVNFVLNSDRLHRHTFGFIAPQKLNEIVGVGRHVLTTHGPAQHRAICLHPSRRTPRGRKQNNSGLTARAWRSIGRR